MTYPHLGLRDWPFRVVPEPEFCDFLADREQLRSEVEELLNGLQNRPTSDIHLIWSWYGAGKTHTLYYLANRCLIRQTDLLPIYAELPREAKGFFDLYRLTIAQVSLDALVDAYLEHSTRPSVRPSFGQTIDPDLNSALTLAALGDRMTKGLLYQWLMGNSLSTAHYRELGVGGRIASTEKCVEILASSIGLLTPRIASTEKTTLPRIIWIIDEIQRVEDLPHSSRRSLLSGLVGVFNKCSTGLTLLLSYTGAPSEDGLPDWIPPDLGDRIGLERPMLLPPMTTSDATVFILDLLKHFRLPQTVLESEFFPFEPTAISNLILALQKMNDLKPRAIMECLDASLKALEPLLRAGTIKTITLQKMQESLSRFALNWPSGKSSPPRRKS